MAGLQRDMLQGISARVGGNDLLAITTTLAQHPRNCGSLRCENIRVYSIET